MRLQSNIQIEMERIRPGRNPRIQKNVSPVHLAKSLRAGMPRMENCERQQVPFKHRLIRLPTRTQIRRSELKSHQKDDNQSPREHRKRVDRL